MLLRTKNFKQIVTAATLAVSILGAARWTFAQAKGQWQRAYTGDGSVIEVQIAWVDGDPILRW